MRTCPPSCSSSSRWAAGTARCPKPRRFCTSSCPPVKAPATSADSSASPAVSASTPTTPRTFSTTSSRPRSAAPIDGPILLQRDLFLPGRCVLVEAGEKLLRRLEIRIGLESELQVLAAQVPTLQVMHHARDLVVSVGGGRDF